MTDASSFSWRDTHREIRASDAVDQHGGTSWCGACYLVAAATSVQDRAHIALARKHRPNRCVRPPRLSLQIIIDHFEERDVVPGWSGCHGGFPLHVLQCMQNRTCPLVWEVASSPHAWLGFPRIVTRCPVSDVASFSVTGARRVPPEEVKRELKEYGPLVLEVSADTLKRLDARGVATDLEAREPDHAVCVVGWQTLENAGACWIIRNSWGTARVPKRIPRDAAECVGRGFNICTVEEWEPWSGMPSDPGFLLLPMSYAPLWSHDPSPWIAATVSAQS